MTYFKAILSIIADLLGIWREHRSEKSATKKKAKEGIDEADTAGDITAAWDRIHRL